MMRFATTPTKKKLPHLTRRAKESKNTVRPPQADERCFYFQY